MPNWCANRLTVTGPTDEMLNFAKIVEGRIAGLTHEQIGELICDADRDRIAEALRNGAPTPEKLSFAVHLPTPEGADIVDWQSANWGTKWDAGEVRRSFHAADGSQIGAEDSTIEEADGTGTPIAAVIYTFETAWSPPDRWLTHIAAIHPNLTFQLAWNEEQGYAGVYDAHGDALDHQHCEPRDLSDLAGWENPPFDGWDDDWDDGGTGDADVADGGEPHAELTAG